MNAKRSFAPVPSVIAEMAANAPGGTAAQPQEAPAAAPRKLPVKDSTKAMSVNMPKGIYDQLRDFWKLTDIPMTQVMVDGTIAELARLKKLHSIE